MIKAGVLGATGFAGNELVDILLRHPEVEIAFLSSASYAGKRYCDTCRSTFKMTLVTPEAVPYANADIVFLCLPHGASSAYAKLAIEAGACCIDLSADFRLRDLSIYETWYGQHQAPELLSQAVYGLTEVYRDSLVGAKLVANPGCYPTGPLLALIPWLKAGLIESKHLIIDAKSGTSGAGAKPSEKTHFMNVHENFSAYNIGRLHRHVPEIEQELAGAAEQDIQIVFSPHLLPITRGILSNIYVTAIDGTSEQDLRASWETTYADEPFITLCAAGKLPELADVARTNACHMALTPAGREGEFIVTTAIDNLVKGASGQAVQNMNVMFGLEETLALTGGKA